jgi:hypothetical protein
VFMPVAVSSSGRLYDDFLCLLFLHAHREVSALTGELPEESDQFRFLLTVCLSNLKGSVGLTFNQGLGNLMRVTIPIDLSTWSFIPLPHFFHSRHARPLLTPSLVLFPQRSALRKYRALRK